MKRYLLTAGLFALAVAFVALAQGPQTALAQFGGGGVQKAKKGGFPPDGSQFPGGVQFGGGGGFQGGGFAPFRLATLEEEFELTEAQRDVRKAHVKAAEIAVKAAEFSFDQLGKLGGVVGPQELTKAKVEVEAARAQLEIRQAELKEVEVKVKYAKKRLDEAKAATGPFRKGPEPKPADPPPPPREK